MATAAVTLAATSMSHLHLLTKQEEIFKTIHSNNFKFKGDGEKHKENWEKGEKIGTGRFSIVYKAKVFIHTNALDMAVKQIKTNEESNQKAADTELDALSKLSHERIVKYYGCCAVEFNLNIFMEYMPLGSLKCYIRKKGALDEDLVHFFTRQLLEGILYLHKQRVIHRDIKSDNILMSDDRGVKLADFGLCKLFGEFSKASTTGVGTSNYMAPERFRDDKYSYPVDIWSLGCVVLEMLTGESPFSTMEQTRIIGILMGEKPSPVEYVKQKLPPSSEQFLCKIFQSDPGARPTASDLFQNDSYLTAEKSLITMESIQDDKTINEEHDEQAVPSTNNSVIETAAVFNDESPLIRYFKDCKNYHNHHKFIPIKKFAKDSLPQSYQDSDLYETINLISELTVKLELKGTSSKRPKFFPNTSVAYPDCSDSGMSSLRLGTGMVCGMEKFTDGYRFNGTKHKKFVTCPCTGCEYSPKCSKTWWEIQVQTAKQLVFDASEALATSCRIFDDGVQGSPAYYLKCLGVGNENIEMDLCRIKYVTCDANVAVKMDESLQGLSGLIKKINRKYQSSKDGDKLAIIVAHPHGTSKHVSIGKWREKKEVLSEKKSFLKFTYTTSACEGSTGALVYCLGYSGIGWWESTLHGGAYHTELNHTGVTF